jgi:putative FmdB family regulatory protein
MRDRGTRGVPFRGCVLTVRHLAEPTRLAPVGGGHQAAPTKITGIVGRRPGRARGVRQRLGRRRRYPSRMPRYEFRCRACGDTFEVNRAMRDAAAPAPCPQGHADTVKLLSTVAVTGRGGTAPAPSAGAGGGCCGGGCGC